MKRPSFQWYPNDWLSASDVRACSIAARGLWIDMICLMHQGIPYGHLTLNGKVVLQGILAKISGISEDEVKVLLGELETLGVFSRTEEGVIFCRRMVEDERLREVRASGGYKALNNPNVPKPNLQGIPSTSTNKDNHQGIPSTSTFKDDQQGNPSSSSSSSSSDKAAADAPPPRKTRRSKPCDEEFLEGLQANPAYRHLNVKALYYRMLVWCENKKKPPSRDRFIGWLNREDPAPTVTLAGGNGAADDEWATREIAATIEDLPPEYHSIAVEPGTTDEQKANVLANYNRRVRQARGLEVGH